MKTSIIAFAASLVMASCIHIEINSESDSDKDYGPAIERVYSIGANYQKLEASHSFNVTMSDTATVATINIDSALHDRVVFIVEKGTLKIGLKPGVYHRIGTASVTMPNNPYLRDIELSGAAQFTTDKDISAEEISIDLSGASVFHGDIKQAKKVDIEASGASCIYSSIQQMTGNMDIDLSGASSATISGSTGVLGIDLSGASNLNASNLDAHAVKGDISGASKAEVLCCESIRVDVSGASHLTYSTIADGCNPIVSCPTSGASSVTRR